MMDIHCMTYVQLAEYLHISINTMRNKWREYPHYFVTEQSYKTKNLKGARFDLDEVMKALKQKQGEPQNGYQILQRSGRRLCGVFQVPRKAIQQGGEDKSRGQTMGSRGKEKAQSNERFATDFDVFPSL